MVLTFIKSIKHSNYLYFSTRDNPVFQTVSGPFINFSVNIVPSNGFRRTAVSVVFIGVFVYHNNNN